MSIFVGDKKKWEIFYQYRPHSSGGIVGSKVRSGTSIAGGHLRWAPTLASVQMHSKMFHSAILCSTFDVLKFLLQE